MAEYYPLLAKAVASLPNSTGDSRKVVYERARKALIGQLRMLHPPVPEEDIERESVALDAAVARLEGELAASAAAPAPRSEIAAEAPVVPDRPPEPARFLAASGGLGPSAAKQPFAPLRTKTPPLKPAADGSQLQAREASPVPVEAAAAAESISAPAAAFESDLPPEPLPQREPTGTDRQGRPRSEQQRPIAPMPPEPKRSRRPLWIIPVAVGVVVVAVALTAFKLRDRPEVLRPRGTDQAQGPTEAGKSVDRVGGPAAGVGADASMAGNGGATPGARSDGQPANATANPAAPIAGRAALLVEAPEEKDKFKTFIGAVVWRLDNVSDGQNQSVGLAVRADVDLPDDKLKATIIIQKNVEASLPASHTLKVRFSVQPGSPSGGIKEINVPQMRREDSASGEPLDGVTVAIVENSFLVGLSPGTAEGSNIEMLRSREWIDIPMRLTNGKIAKMTFEKTAAGQRYLQEAIAAWSKS